MLHQCQRLGRQLPGQDRSALFGQILTEQGGRRGVAAQVVDQSGHCGGDFRIAPVIATAVTERIPAQQAQLLGIPVIMALPCFRVGLHALVEDVDQL